jgi:hypothetical protein
VAVSTTFDEDGDVDDTEIDDAEEDGESGELVLVFTAEGQCVLEEDGEQVWASDDDDDFQTEFENEFLSEDEDSGRVLNWLVDEGWVDEEEKGEVEIETETNGDGENEEF